MDRVFALMPHGSCFLWDRDLTGLHVSSDVIIAAAYFSIPAMMFLNRRHASEAARPVLVLFAAFILSCGVGHGIAAWNIWHANYWVEGSEKMVTALISGVTAIELQRRMPSMLGTQKALEKSEILARQDALTGLANRRGLEEAMENLLHHATVKDSEHMLLLLDLDGFKQINDIHGHPAGDGLLKDVAEALTLNVRPRESYVARLGGDEFAILLENCTVEEAVAIAQRLRDAIALVPYAANLSMPVQTSIGMAKLTCQCNELDAYIAADKALYHSKAAGKNLITWRQIATSAGDSTVLFDTA
ncbi:hypothetical protein C7271_10970 [filamentous cyanobacterium CCP5]|nr:hypothetical protein C7271_10970 [filamentous cyanobacterium CCP5]